MKNNENGTKFTKIAKFSFIPLVVMLLFLLYDSATLTAIRVPGWPLLSNMNSSFYQFSVRNLPFDVHMSEAPVIDGVSVDIEPNFDYARFRFDESEVGEIFRAFFFNRRYSVYENRLYFAITDPATFLDNPFYHLNLILKSVVDLYRLNGEVAFSFTEQQALTLLTQEMSIYFDTSDYLDFLDQLDIVNLAYFFRLQGHRGFHDDIIHAVHRQQRLQRLVQSYVSIFLVAVVISIGVSVVIRKY